MILSITDWLLSDMAIFYHTTCTVLVIFINNLQPYELYFKINSFHPLILSSHAPSSPHFFKHTNCSKTHILNELSMNGTNAVTDHVSKLPHELLLYLLLFVADIDLQTLRCASHLYRSLTIDKILWSKILLGRNPRLVSASFTKWNRPSRIDLIGLNILKSAASQEILTRMVLSGGYTNGPFAVASYEAGLGISKLYIMHTLNRRLNSRPSVEELRY